MSEMISKCGFLCSSCPWSKSIQDSMSAKDYELYKKGCKETLGYAPSGTIQNCVGCQTPEEQWPENTRIPLKNCITRQCVLKSGIDNCAYCSRFPCESIILRASEWSREKIEKKFNKTISDEQFNNYVKSFEGYNRLLEIRQKLTDDKIVKVKTLPLLAEKIIEFPQELSLPLESIKFYKKIYDFLKEVLSSPLDMKDIDTFAQQERLKNLKKHIMRFLWIIGTFSELDIENNNLVVEPNNYLKNRFSETSLGEFTFLNNIIIPKLRLFGLTAEFFEIKEGKKSVNPITPTGAIRYQGWRINVAFSEVSDNLEMLKAFQDYCQKLFNKFDKKSFGYFMKNDFTILSN